LPDQAINIVLTLFLASKSDRTVTSLYGRPEIRILCGGIPDMVLVVTRFTGHASGSAAINAPTAMVALVFINDRTIGAFVQQAPEQ